MDVSGGSMNKTSIEWCDYTWNPVTGCLHGCPYCYARKIAERFTGSKAWPQGFKPMFHPERLNDPAKMKKPQTIFVCSMADLFGEWVPDLWINLIFAEIQKAKQHTYIFLTKNPSRYLKIPGTYFSKNLWFGTTVTGIGDIDRVYELQKLPAYINKFISFEPLLAVIPHLDLIGSPFEEPSIKQVIVGAQTNPSVEVTPEMMQPIGGATCPGVVPTIKMFCKDSMPMWARCRRELCWQVHK
jgi:protein gp37